MILETILAQLKIIGEIIAALLVSFGLMGGTEPILIEKPIPEPIIEEVIPWNEMPQAVAKIEYILNNCDKDLRCGEVKLKNKKELTKNVKRWLEYIPLDHKHIIRKGDVDVEIVLDVVRIVDDLDAIIILSGDSDFLELKNYVVHDKRKKIIFLGYEENMAWELRQCWHIYANRIRNIVGRM